MGKYSSFGKLIETLDNCEPDWVKEVSDIVGADCNSENRMKQHIKAMIFAALSGNSCWQRIAGNADKIDEIFKYYDCDELLNSDPVALSKAVKNIRCGNRRMNLYFKPSENGKVGLFTNIEIFKRMYDDNLFDFRNGYAAYAESEDDIIRLIRLFAEGTYKGKITTADGKEITARDLKLKGMGIPLVCEYLKSLNINTAKPDVHVRRILYRLYSEGAKRNKCQLVSELSALHICNEIAKEYRSVLNERSAKCQPSILVDTVLWQLGSKGICAAKNDGADDCVSKGCLARGYCKHYIYGNKQR